MPSLNEDTLAEQPVLGWLKELGYDCEFGPDISPGGLKPERAHREVVLKERLLRSLRRLNPQLSDVAIEEAVQKLKRVEHPNLEIANREAYQMLTHGVRVDVRDERGETRGEIARVMDFENAANNEFLAVNQFTVQGAERFRRPDVVVFINGVPVAVFELKSPTQEDATTWGAYDQLQEYKRDIPELFKYNQVLVVSDQLEARHGTISSPREWFAPWKGIGSEDERHAGRFELETLVKGIFHRARLLDIIKDFIVFEADSEKDATKYTKKMCLYHQYYGVNRAVTETVRAARPRGNRKIGVFWHTQGSGKSLSMVFYVNKAKELEALKSPTFVFLTDRTDLDGQLHRTFLRTGYGALAKQAESIADLKRRLRSAVGELVFTTIQKFEGEDYATLSEQENIIVIADEAHRSQYAKLAGNVRRALPNASFMGITGTPISLRNRDTQLVFGEHVSVYQVNRAVDDGATVPIYYEGRLVPLHLANEFLDEEFEDLLPEVGFEAKEELKRKWARLEQAIGAPNRLEQIARDIVEHFNNRGLEGKAMVVTMSRRIAVEMYRLLSRQLGAPHMAVVISKPEEYEGQIQQELDARELEKQFKNPEDPLAMVIVCDMWLTGFDVPPLHTMYVDKPLKNHTLMQAIARVNRIFRDKRGGLVVDYIGIADDLRRALSIYSSKVRKETLVPIEEIAAKMLEKYDIVRSMLSGVDYASWKKLGSTQLVELIRQAVDAVVSDPQTRVIDEERKKRFAKEAELLFQLFAFVMPHHEAVKIRNDVEFFRAAKKVVDKRTAAPKRSVADPGLESTVKELISRSIAAEGVVDIFRLKEKGRPDISIFDEKFLEEVQKMRYRNLAIETLRRLLRDELQIRRRKNEARYRSLIEILDRLIEEYENRLISSSKVIEQLIELARKIKDTEAEGERLGLSDEELAFYDALTAGKKGIAGDDQTKRLVKDLVRLVRRDLTVDWTNNDMIRSRIRANVRLLLLRNDFSREESESVLEKIFAQAMVLYRDFSPATGSTLLVF